jgi:hypothetical protein
MSVKTQKPAVDRRTPEQKRVDELAAAGDWSEFTIEQLMPEDLAFDLLSRAEDIRQEMAAKLAAQPFLWKGKAYRILRCEVIDGEGIVAVTPDDSAFAAELKRRVESSRSHVLTFYQGIGFICFPEDYSKHKES